MASAGTLYTFTGQATGKRILATAAAAGVKLEVQEIVFGETNKSPEFKAKFPHGKVPAFESADGFCLFETNAICRYVVTLSPNSTLTGTSHHESALIEQWISFADKEIGVHQSSAAYLTRGRVPYSKPIETLYKDNMFRGLDLLESHLQTCTFLVGHRISLADITMASVLQQAFQIYLGVAEREKYPNIYRYFQTVVNQPTLKTAFGQTNYVETALQYTAPKKDAKEKEKPAKHATNVVAGAAGAVAGAVSSAAGAAVAAVTPKSKKNKDEDDDEEEPLVPEEPKAKNPLDDLPKSTFNLEDWKRAYSNMETKGSGGSIEWFYNKFDPAGFSVWRVDFKYNEELTQVFMSSNQIGGFFNRLEASRKYLFGSMGVLGSANDSVISGIFICRGPGYKPVVDVAPDWDSYAYKEINLHNPEDKKFFEDALAWDLELGGKKWADGKNFK